MTRIWAPWRMKAIMESKQKRGCIFCRLLEMQDGPENLILHRNSETFTIVNKYPYNTGHLMVIPIAHGADITKTTASTMAAIGSEVQKAVGILQTVYGPAGYNIGTNLGEAAGAGVPDHLHYHIVPRWVGDNNFMPAIGELKVLPETPEETYQRLKASFLGR